MMPSRPAGGGCRRRAASLPAALVGDAAPITIVDTSDPMPLIENTAPFWAHQRRGAMMGVGGVG